MQKTRVRHTNVFKYRDGKIDQKPDLLAMEEPLEIRLVAEQLVKKEESLAVTMRTPGNDFELALGFLFTEGIIKSHNDVSSIQYCQQVKSAEEEGNVVKVYINSDVPLDLKKLERNFYMTSSCGVCGKSSIEALEINCKSISTDFIVKKELLITAPDKMRDQQRVFEHTGGLHAAALFDSTGELIFLREDIGRHNALDKVIGAALNDQLIPLSKYFVMVSGRVGFELVQKCVMAGVPLLGAVGAPSSLAVETANAYKMTLAGFVRNGNLNVYSNENRIV